MEKAFITKKNLCVLFNFGNPKFPVDIRAVAEAAAHYNVALEINNSSFTTSRPGSEPNCRAI
ncbi:MAG: hypothetical protein E6663_03210, partial [Staphylococcus lugdunensis]|nr:hypothetical protein [Staphylococcus lugdunensis]